MTEAMFGQHRSGQGSPMPGRRLFGFLLPVFLLPGLFGHGEHGDDAKPGRPAGEGAFVDTAGSSSEGIRRNTGVAYSPVAGLGTAVEVPARTSATVLVTFSSTPSCTGDAGGRCLVRIAVDGRTMDPAAGSDSVFEVAGEGHTAGGSGGHAIVRTLPDVGPGRHRIVVETAVSSDVGSKPPPRLELSRSSLIAQAVRD